MSDCWKRPHYASFTLWDIDREFQHAHEAYKQYLARNRRKRAMWDCFGRRNRDDRLAKALSLGRNVHEVMESGREAFGARFEKGDSTCYAILAAQLLRVQSEINVPLLDCALSRMPISIPHDDILTAAKTVRRACYHALCDQYTRLHSPGPTPFLPPPRFSVNFCPFALQIQKDRASSRKSVTLSFQTKKVRPHDRYDEREICPYCSAHISVSAHSGLPEYRRLLFQSHTSCSRKSGDDATFACTSCYKTFDDSYGFLDHIFQKEIGSERSCLKRYSARWSINEAFNENDSELVEKCLRNCLMRELTRVRALNKSKELESYRDKEEKPLDGRGYRNTTLPALGY